MPQAVQILTTDIYLERLLYLLLTKWGFAPMLTQHASDTAVPTHLRLVDTDRFADIPLRDEDIALSRSGTPTAFRSHDRRLTVPFSHDALLSLLQSTPTASEAPLRLQDHTAVLHGEPIPLTDTEYILLRALIDADGEYVSRAELQAYMSDGRGSESGLNVYIHYIRKKLERDGERIVLCSRASGYRIHPSFLQKSPKKP